MDYGASGLTQRLEHWLADSRTLEDVKLLTSVTDWSLQESWSGDYRQTGSVTLDGESLPLWGALRTYVVTDDGTGPVREALATLIPGVPDVELRRGRIVSTYNLYSSMAKLAGNAIDDDWGIGRGWSVAGHFEWLCRESGCVPSVHQGVKDAVTRSVRVWEAGETYLTEAHAMADACNGRIEPDVYGRVCIVPYQRPALVAQSFDVAAGSNVAVVKIGVTSTSSDICNRVVATYEENDRQWSSEAVVDPSHPWSYERTGRWATVVVSPPQIKDGENVQTVLDRLAVQTLSEHSDVSETYSVRMLYAPIRVGQAGTIHYCDSPGMSPVPLSGFVSQRQIKKSGAAVEMELTIEEV